MVKAQAVESNNVDHASTDLDSQAAFEFGQRLRARAEQMGKKQGEIGRAADIKRGAMTGYWAGERVPPANKLFLIADFLDIDARFLASGVKPTSALVDASDADWIEVPEYDLREITDDSLGRALITAPIRRDWLYSIVRAVSGLWLTRISSDYTPAGLSEGDLVICRSVRREDLAEGHVCLWRIADTVVVGRFSVMPDELMARGQVPDQPGMLTPFLDAALGIQAGDLIVPPSAIAAGRYHLIGRILGTMVRPL
jgi:transcriptional regulator with XRE-family HTH domain